MRLRYNYLFFADTEESAHNLAKTFFTFEEVDGHGVASFNDYEAHLFFLSTQDLYPQVTCTGFIDCFVCQRPSDDMSRDLFDKEIDRMQLFGTRVIFGDEESEDSALHHFAYTEDKISDQNVIDLVVNTPHEFASKLRIAFDSKDTGNTGKISTQDLKNLAVEMDVQLNPEDSYAYEAENATFAQAKTFVYCNARLSGNFRNYNIAEEDIHSALKQEKEGKLILKTFGLEIDESADATKVDVEIGHIEEIENGMGINTSFSVGAKYNEIESSLPCHYRTDIGVLGIRIGVKDPSVLEEIRTLLNQFRADAIDGMDIAPFFATGGSFALYLDGSDLCVEAKISGLQNEYFGYIKDELKNLDSISLQDEAKLFTSLTVSDIRDLDLDGIAEKLAKYRITEKGQGRHVSGILAWMVVLIEENTFEEFGLGLEAAQELLFKLIKIVDAFKTFELKIGMDCDSIGVNIKKAVPQEIKDMFEGMRSEMLDQVEGMKGMAEEIVGPFKHLLQALDYDKIAIVLNSRIARLNAKVELHLPGLTDQINDLVLD